MFGNDHDELFKRIRQGDYSGEIVVDPDTPLEHFFSIPLYAGVLCLILGGLWAFFSGQAAAWSMFKYGLLLFPVGAFLSTQVEVNYRIDLEAKTVKLHRRVFLWQGKSPVCDLSQVECVADDTSVSFHGDGSRRRREYRSGLVLVLKKGTLLRVTGLDFKDHGAVAEHGERLANLLGVPYRSGAGQLQVRRTAQGPQITYKPSPTLSTWDTLTGGCAGLVLVAGLTFGLLDRFFNGAHSPRRPSPSAPKNYDGVDLVPELWQDGQVFGVYVNNHGSKDCPRPFQVIMEVDGKKILSQTFSKHLQPADGRRFRATVKKGKQLKVTVDVKNEIAESDENNNVATRSLSR